MPNYYFNNTTCQFERSRELLIDRQTRIVLFLLQKKWNLYLAKLYLILIFTRALALNKRGADSGECFF